MKSYFTNAGLRLVSVSFLCMSLFILAQPGTVWCTDRLIVTDPAEVFTEFAAGDDGTIRLNSNTLPASVASWSLIYGSSNNSNTGYTMDSYGSTPTLGGGGAFRFARGTQSSPAAVQVGDRLGFFVFSGYDGSNFVNTAGFTARVDNTVSANNIPSKLVFETLAQNGETPDDSVRVERMVISSNGYVGIGGSGQLGTGIPAPVHPLQVGNAYITTGGVWTNASSRAYKENIYALTTEEADKTLEGLNPVKYNYKADKDDRHVGFIAEDVPDLVATKDRKGLSAMDIVAVLTKVVQEQKDMIAELAEKVEALRREVATFRNLP